MSFDAIFLNHVWDSEIDLDSCIDTLVLSYLYNPALDIPQELIKQNQELGEKKGPHGLEAWGFRLKYPKGNYDDWSKLTEEMVEYCRQDVRLTLKVYEALRKKMLKLGYSELSCEIEHKIRVVIDEQQRNGFWFDKVGADDFRQYLRREQSHLSEEISALFPPRREKVAEYTFRRRKDGSPTASYETHRSKYSDLVHTRNDKGEEIYECYELVPFNLNSPKQRVERLLELGWEPDKFTKKGFPQVDEESLVRYAEKSGRKEISAMAEYLVIQGRASMLDTWLNNLSDDSRIHGRVVTCGATTRRMIHSQPNSANIPSGSKAKYGHECRSFWGVEPNKGLIEVGADASGLENVGLLHYLNNPKATELLTQKKPNDVHSLNARGMSEALGFECDREWAGKTCVPLDTRILTRRGWKHFNEIEIGEEVLGYNQESKHKEWTKLIGIYTGKDEVIEVANSRRVFRATNNHRWFIRQRRMGTKSWSKINGRYLEDQIRTTKELSKESSIIMNAPFNTEQDTNSSIKNLDGKYDVNWEQKILDMSHSERVQWLQGFMLADGYIPTKPPHTWRWTQNKGNIAEAALLASYLVHDGQIHISERRNKNHDMWTCTLSAKSHITGQKLKKTSLGIQPVWCPQTELGSWVMRQEDNITITGNCFFALVFGAGDEKLGSIVKKGSKEGKIIREVIIKNIPGFEELLEKIKKEFFRTGGRMETVDGGFVLCPSLNAALNYKVQSSGACVMKLASILLREEARKQELWFKLLGTIHDEWQMETKVENGDKLGKLAIESMTKAAKILKFNVPLFGEYKLGYTWAECH